MAHIFLKDSRAALVTCVYAPEEKEGRRPALAIYADLSKVHYPKLMDSPEKMSISGFIIDSIEAEMDNIMSPMVRVKFRTEQDRITVRVPIQFLAAAYRLSTLNQGTGGIPIFMVDSSQAEQINPARVMSIQEMAFMLMFPMPGSDAGLAIEETFSALIHESVATPGADLNWDDESDDDESRMDPATHFLLSHSLTSILSLSRGDLAPMFSTPEMLDDSETQVLPGKAHFIVLSHVLGIIGESSPARRAAYTADGAGPSMPSAEFNYYFHRMMTADAELDASMNDILQSIGVADDEDHASWAQQVNMWNAPAAESWPEAMMPVKEYLEQEEILEDIHDIIDDLPDTIEDYVKSEQTYGDTTVLLALYIYIAQQAHKRHTLLALDDDLITAQSVILSWLSQDHESRWWELESVAGELLSYNTANAADIVMAGAHRHEDSVALPYTMPLMIEIGAFLMEEEHFGALDSDELARELSKLNFRGRDYADFESFILRYHRKIEETIEEIDDAPDARVIAFHALHPLIEASMDFHRLASVVLMAFPVFAELRATAEAEPWSEDWQEIRAQVLAEMISTCADNIRRNVGDDDDEG